MTRAVWSFLVFGPISIVAPRPFSGPPDGGVFRLNLRRGTPGHFGRAMVTGNFSAVTGACLVVRKAIYEAVGGLDEVNLTVAYNDIDFCLKVRDAGYLNVWTPFAELYHFEGKSRGIEDNPQKVRRFNDEVAFIKRQWGHLLTADPYYSPNFSLDHQSFVLAFLPRNVSLD